VPADTYGNFVIHYVTFWQFIIW